MIFGLTHPQNIKFLTIFVPKWVFDNFKDKGYTVWGFSFSGFLIIIIGFCSDGEGGFIWRGNLQIFESFEGLFKVFQKI